MKHSKKKRRRTRPVGKSVGGESNGEEEEERIINNLVEAFTLASVEEAKAVYKEANGDPNKAVEIFSSLSDSSEAFQTSCSSSSQSFGLDSSSSEGFAEANGAIEDLNSRGFRGNRGKKVVASTGTVSTVLGKKLVVSNPRKELMKPKGGGGGKVNIHEAEQFLCSMLGDDCELSMGVVKDVLCSCGYDVEKALEVLLDLSASPCEQSNGDNYYSFSASNGEDPRNIAIDDNFWEPTDRGSDSNSHVSESEFQDSIQLLDSTRRNYADALISSCSSSKLAGASLRTDGSELPQQVLESLFNMPKSTEREANTMNWKNVVKLIESFAQKGSEHCPVPAGSQRNTLAKGAEYRVCRETAQQQWIKTNSCYRRAAAAYSTGEKNYASYMSDQGKFHRKMAQEADEKASMEIFKARNEGMQNVLTIDLHGQHVKPALRLVKLHLLFGTYISSVQYIRIITGCGSHGLGKSKLKQSVISLAEQEGIKWREENKGTVLIKLDGPREFSFLNSGSDSDSG